MSQPLSVRRRQRADSDDEQRPSSSGSGKRQKGNNGHARDSPEDEQTNESGHKPGSIVRVAITNFVTYEKAEFFPGPSLNMVIGPNGTGKSSLVCAICLGLGWPPSMLGRADKFDDFIKHGKKDAYVEIELKGESDEDSNYTIKVQFMKGNKRRWWINGRDATHDKVRDLTRRLSIQIDNLCQFLPQDKVSEFAGLSPKELLHSTQRAAAPPEMLQLHNNLIELRKKEKALQQKHNADEESLKSNQKKRDELQDDVEKVRDIEKSKKKLDKYKKGKPFVEYKARRLEVKDLKVEERKARRRLKVLQERVQPTLLAINEKQEYQRQVLVVKNERVQLVKKAEHDITAITGELRAAEEAIGQIEQSIKSEHESDIARKKSIQGHQKKVTELEAKRKNPPPFDAADWNRKIKEETDRGRALANEIDDLRGQVEIARNASRPIRNVIEDTQRRMESMASQAGLKLARLAHHSPDTAKAWEWIQDHQGDFEKPVYGPPLIECSIKEGCEQYLDSVEAFLNRDTVLTITTQTRNDYRKLTGILRDDLGLSETYLRTSNHPLATYQPPVNPQQMKDLGFDGFARDFIDGPDPIVAMLCDTLKLHSTGITLKNISDGQYNRLTAEDSRIATWVSGGTSYKVFRRREYGPSAVSTSANTVNRARWWIDQPVDSTAKQELQTKFDQHKAQFDELKARAREMQNSIAKLAPQQNESDEKRAQLMHDKGELQKEQTFYLTLPSKIEKEMEALRKRQQDGAKSREKIQKLRFEKNGAMLEKAAIAFRYKDQFVKLHQSHEALLEAEIRLVEAKSDFEALQEENRDVGKQLIEAEASVEQIVNRADEAKDRARRMLATVRAIQAEIDDAELSDYLNNLASPDSSTTLDELEIKIGAEKAFLDTNFAANPNAIHDFDTYNKNVEKYEDRLKESTAQLETYAAQIAEIKNEWEPALDKLIDDISNAFSYNFQQIGCAGEVGIHKDDDFDEWSLEIKVKFREEGELQLLDSHRQSGGERSVSTIFYLMSLQSMARAPFRVVDEINQGMDPRNERMVHERMVDIACKEHTSQYFLITPKLLPNLRYDRRMRVLCIASGEYMPQNHDTVSVSKAIAIKRALIAAH